MSKTRYRLALDAALELGAEVTVTDATAHYLLHVLRLNAGDMLDVFNRTHGQWRARISTTRKKQVSLRIEECTRPPSASAAQLTVCFAPIKGGRMETIIEKATELGASILQPVITARTIVDKVNMGRAEAIAREAAEQCERIDWPELRAPVKLLNLLGDWPAHLPLIYGDESGNSDSISTLAIRLRAMSASQSGEPMAASAHGTVNAWGILVGPEGGFTPDEFAALARVNAAMGVGLGPRILRADTAVITLCAITMQHWGDWAQAPRFVPEGEH